MPIYELLRSKGFEVITVRPTTAVSEALALLKEYNVGTVVVSTDGKEISQCQRCRPPIGHGDLP